MASLCACLQLKVNKICAISLAFTFVQCKRALPITHTILNLQLPQSVPTTLKRSQSSIIVKLITHKITTVCFLFIQHVNILPPSWWFLIPHQGSPLSGPVSITGSPGDIGDCFLIQSTLTQLGHWKPTTFTFLFLRDQWCNLSGIDPDRLNNLWVLPVMVGHMAVKMAAEIQNVFDFTSYLLSIED